MARKLPCDWAEIWRFFRILRVNSIDERVWYRQKTWYKNSTAIGNMMQP
jgi:hypothetical protein